MKNVLLDKGIILPSGEINKDKINLVAGAITQPLAEMVWVTTGGDKDVFQAVGSATDVGSNPHSMGGYLLHELFSHHLQSACRAGIPNHGYRFCVRCDCRSRSS